MTELLVLASLFGAGLLMVITAQPHGAPRVSLASRLQSLRPHPVTVAPHRGGERMFRTQLLEDLLRRPLERAGRATAAILGLAGLSLRTTEERLRAAGDRGSLGLFWGQKLGGALVGFSVLPLAAALGLAPWTHAGSWLVAATAGFLLPDVLLRSRAEARRRRMREDLLLLAELLALSVSGGVGMEGALEGAIAGRSAPLFDELRRLTREARLRGKPGSAALLALPVEAGFHDAEPLAAAVSSASEHGTPVTQALRAQARALRERRRLELIEAGERAQIRMLLPTGLLILPAFFVVVLYPAAVQLLKATGL
jgi:tight adherence protein C